MLENTESKTLKTNAGDLLNILENLKKPDSSQMDILKNSFKKSEEKVREQIDGKINLDSILKDNPSFAKELTEAKKMAVKPADKKEDKKNEENPGKADAGDLEDVEKPTEEVASAGADDGEFDISELAGKLSAALKTKDGDK